MSESAVQMPTLIHTEIGGKKTARIARKRSEPHIARWRGFPLYEVVPNVIFNVNIAVVSSQ